MRFRWPAGKLMIPGRIHSASALIALAVLTSLFCACHSSNEEKRTLYIQGAVHVYPNEVPPAVYPGPDFIEVLGPKDQVKVQQVVYKNGYMAVKVKLKDGREGWVFSGESIVLK
jgi:hypothetical protein